MSTPDPANTAPSLDVSPAEAFLEGEPAVVELPRRGANGVALRVKIRARPLSRCLRVFKWSLPLQAEIEAAKAAAGVVPEAIQAKIRAEAEENEREFMRESILEPRFAFTLDDTSAPYFYDIHPENRVALLDAIISHSGGTLKEDAAEQITFRYVERGGVRVGE